MFEEEGLVLLDYNQQMQQITKFDDQVKDIVICNNFIYINSKGKQLKILRLENKKILTSVNQWIPPNSELVDYFLVSDDENTIFLACGSHFIILDIQKKLSPTIRKIDLINPSFIQLPSLSYSTVWITQVGSFMFLSNQKGHLNVLQLSNDYSSFSYISQLSKFGNNSILSCFVQSAGILFSLSRYYGLYIFDVSLLLMQNPDIDGFIKYTSGKPTIITFTGTIQHMLLSSDNNFLFIALRSVGLWVYNISQDPYNPQLAQKLLSNGVAFKLHFFRGSSFKIFLSDGDNLKIYQQIQQQQNNLYNQYNVFNTNSCISMKPFENEKWPWFIVNSKDDNYIAVSGGVYGLNIYDISGDNINNPVLVFHDSNSGDQYYSLLYLDKKDLLIVAQNKQGTVIYDVADFSDPKLIVQYQPDSNINYHSDYFTNRDQTLLAIVAFNSVTILDISEVRDSSNLQLITRYYLPLNNGIQRVISSVIFNSEFSYGFYTVREYGVFAFRITSNSNQEMPQDLGKLQLNLVVFKSFYSQGAQYINYDINENYVYLSDGNNGVAIIDVTKPDQPNIIARVQVNGWAVKTYQPTLNQDILFVNQMEKGQISIIDISNKAYPIKISELQFGQENSFSLVTNKLASRYYFAFTIEKGFRICPNNQQIQLLLSFYSKNIDGMNFTPKDTDSYQQEGVNINSNSIASNNLSTNEVYISDEVQINLSPLYYQYQLRLNSISYYKNFQIALTPSWIAFDQRDMHIILIPSYIEIPADQDTITLLLTVQSQLSPHHLTSDLISYDQALKFMEGLRTKGLLDEDDYFEPSPEGIYFSIPVINKVFGQLPQKKLITEQVIYNLRQIQFIYLLALKIKPSLIINKNPKNTTIPFVSTFSTNVQLDILLSIDHNRRLLVDKAMQLPIQFVQIQYTEILVSLSGNNTLMKIKAEKNLLNQKIKKGFLYGIKSSNQIPLEDIQAKFTINDDVNKPVTISFKLNECPYLNKLEPLQLSLTTSLKEQYKIQFPSDLTVEEQFTIQFTNNIFINPSEQQLMYTAFLLSDGEWVQILNNSSLWIDFDPINLTLKGLKQLGDLFKSYKIKIVATDSFSNVEDQFIISFTQLSIFMILMLTFVALILFFIILGIYFCRNSIHKYFKYYEISYNDLVINAKVVYKKAIVIAPHTQSNLDLLVKELIKNTREQFKNQQNYKNLSYNYIKQAIVSKYTNIDNGDVLLQNLSDDAKNIYHRYPAKFKNLSGHELSQIDSRINIALFCVIAKWALQFDKETSKAFNKFKEYAKNKMRTSDWYLVKLFLIKYHPFFLYKKVFYSQDNKDSQKRNHQQSCQFFIINKKYYLQVVEQKQTENGGTNSRATGSSDQEFPPMYQILQIEEDNFDQVLEIIKENKRKQSKDITIKQKILENAIRAEYYGFQEEIKPKNWHVNFGQTMHLRMNQVSQVVVKQKEEEKTKKKKLVYHIPCIRYIRQKFQMNFKRITLKNANKQNTNLPKWMTFEISDNNIIFSFRPQQKDIGEYIVELYNQYKYAFYIFKIQVRGSQRLFNQQQENTPRSNMNINTNQNQGLLSPNYNQEQDNNIQVLTSSSRNQAIRVLAFKFLLTLIIIDIIFQRTGGVCVRVFSTLPQIELQTQETFNLTLTKSEMNIAYPGFFFLTFGVSQFVVIDQADYQIVGQIKGNIVNVLVRTNFIYAQMMDDAILIMKFDTKRKQLNSVNRFNAKIIINCFEVLANEEYLLLANYGQIHIVSLKSKLNPYIIKKVGPSLQVETAQMAIDDTFVFLSNKGKNLGIFDFSNSVEQMVFTTGISLKNASYFGTFMDYKNKKYFYSYSKYFGIVTYDFTMLYFDQNRFVQLAQQQNDKPFINSILTLSETVNHFIVSRLFNHLILAVRSNGIYIYQQSDQGLTFIQQVRSPNLSNYVFFADFDEKFLLLADGLSMKIFIAQNFDQIEEPNSLNVFNIKQNSMAISRFQMNQYSDRGNIAIDEVNSLIFISNKTNILIYSNQDFQYPYSDFQTQTQKQYTISSFIFLKSGYLVALRDPEIITFYRINKLSSNTYPTLNFPCKQCEFSSSTVDINETILFVVTVNSILFYDLTSIDLTNLTQPPKLLLQYMPEDITSEYYLNQLSIHSNNKMGFYSIKGYSINLFSFQITNNQAQIQVLKSYRLQDLEYHAYDVRNYNYLIVSSGTQGILIFDCSSIDNGILPKQIHQVPIQGWVTNFHQPPTKPNIILVNQSQGVQMSILSIEDILNSKKIYEINFSRDELIYESVLFTHNSDGFLALSTNKGFRYSPISKSINLYYFIMKKSQINTIKINQQNSINLQRAFEDGEFHQESSTQISIQVNDISEIRVAPILTNTKIKFNDIFLHQNYELLSPPPTWLTYDKDELLIKIQPPKETQLYNQGEIIIILQIYQSISPTYFTKIYPITKQESLDIFNLFVQTQLIDKQGMFLQKEEYQLQYLEEDLIKILKNLSQTELEQALELISFSYQTLQYLYPIQLKVVPSLKLNLLSNDVIISLDNSCKINIKIIKKSSTNIKLFAQKSQDSILISFSNDQLELLLEGNRQQINDFVVNSLNYGIFYNSTLSELDPLISFSVTDKFNYPVEQTISMVQISYIKRIPSLIQNKDLQSQYEDLYPNGLTINDDYNIQFEISSFQNSDYIPISFKVIPLNMCLYFINTNFNMINQAYLVDSTDKDSPKLEICSFTCDYFNWIRFDCKQMRIHGQAGFIRFRKTYLILVEASDEFGSINDYFEIEFNNLPIQLIIILTFLSILIFILIILVYVFRKSILKITSYYSYSYNKIEVFIKQKYFKCIVCTPHSLNSARLMFKFLKKDFYSNLNKQTQTSDNENKQKDKTIGNIQAYFALHYSDEKGNIDMKKVTERAVHIYKIHKPKFPNIQYSSITSQNTNFRTGLFSLFSLELLAFSQAKLIYKEIKNIAKKDNHYQDWYKVILLKQKLKELLTINEDSFKKDKYDLFQNKQDQLDKDFTSYPEVQLNKKKIIDKLQNNKKYKQLIEDQRNLNIVENALKAQLYGYDNQTQIKDWKCNIGETLHMKADRVYQIEIYEKMNYPSKIENLFCFFFPFFKERFYYQYKNICSNKLLNPENNFPKWIQIVLANNTIVIKLSPRRANVGEYIISFKNIKGFTIYSFGVSFVFPKSPSIASYQGTKKVEVQNLSELNPTVQIPEEESGEEENEEDEDEEESNESSSNQNKKKGKKFNLFKFQSSENKPNEVSAYHNSQQSPLSKLQIKKQNSFQYQRNNTLQNFNKNQVITVESTNQTHFTKIDLQKDKSEQFIFDNKKVETAKSLFLLKSYSKTFNTEQSNNNDTIQFLN